jgi:polar amino acid transport system ATP-binding protein
MNFARDVSDRIAFFHQGLMEEVGAPDQLINNPVSEHTKKFLSNVR